MNETQYVLYILMRTDLPSMNAGKAMAQASHASNAFVKRLCEAVPPNVVDIGRQWQQQTNQGFGTVLVLGATLNDILKVQGQYKREHSVFGRVIDPTYPYIVNSEIVGLIKTECHAGESPIPLESGDFLCLREEVTCAYLFADKNNEQTKELLKELKLHP